MKRKPRNLFMLPREIRIRLVIAFSLMAIIPLLSTIYFVSIYIANVQMPVHWIKVTLLTSMMLMCAGFAIMRNCIWSIIDISHTTDQLLSNPVRKKHADNELLRFEHFLLYMEDQIYAAKRILRAKRKFDPPVRSFKLPTLIPTSLVKNRLLNLTKNAELSCGQIGVFAWQNSNISKNESNDETFVPPWLINFLKNISVTPDAIGQLKPGYWIGWSENKNVKEMNEYLKTARKNVSSTNFNDITIVAFSHPSAQSDLSFLRSSIEILEID